MSHEWQQHSKLRQRFHAEAPDDLQVIVHDGGPRLSKNSPELVWVTVIGADESDVFTGRVLNQPQQLENCFSGDLDQVRGARWRSSCDGHGKVSARTRPLEHSRLQQVRFQ